MKTLTGPCLKIFSCNYVQKHSGILCPRDVFLGRQQAGFLEHSSNFDVRFSLSIPFKHKTVYSVFSSSTQTIIRDEEDMQINYDTDQPKTVHVRFKLHKECTFGQQVLIVGDDPIFGMWDPSNAIPLTWSDGHEWNVELDIPSGKLIRYKFIVKGEDDTVSWQPGPNRILEMWDTGKTITIVEDWDEPIFRKISEDELLFTDQEDRSILIPEVVASDEIDVTRQNDGSILIPEVVASNEIDATRQNNESILIPEVVASNEIDVIRHNE